MRTHLKRGTKTYAAWNQMRQRCTNPNNDWYHRYGGRGITYQQSWNTFECFYADMGDCPQGLTLERKDNDCGYSKENCVWASRKRQACNRSTNVKVEFNGVIRTVKEWSEVVGLNYGTFRTRLLHGWPIELALSSPLRSGSRPESLR